MRALITGSNGTVGSALRRALSAGGHEAVGWDRAAVPNDDYGVMARFVAEVRPDVLFHLAVASQPTQPQSTAAESWHVNYTWSSELAWICREQGVRFVFSSTVMVFNDKQPGPYTISSPPNEDSGYGMEKRRAEERIFQQNPQARIARLGWQIGGDLSGNQMVAWLAARQRVEASVRWMPACSMLFDTARGLLHVAAARPGLHLLDSNEGWSFYDIACALRDRHSAGWEIVPTWERAYDQRMIDLRVPMPSLDERLPGLNDLEP